MSAAVLQAVPGTGIDVSGLNVWFDDHQVLHGVSFSVPEGGALGLVGESGSGKSTVLRALCGLVDQWSGALRIDGADLGKTRSRGFYRVVQMVFQDPFASLHPRHTIDRTLSEPAQVHELDRVEDRVVTALEQVGLDRSFRFRFPHQLSGGQRQRVAIARALMLEPRVLLLDEPTSALDVSIQAEVLNLLKGLQRDLGLTTLMVSHDLAVVSHMCNAVAIMNRGRILETIAAEDLAAGRVDHPYSQQLLRASSGFDRAMIDSFVDWE